MKETTGRGVRVRRARIISEPISEYMREALIRIDAELAWITSHTFRKTAVTRLDDAGLSARKIAEHVGHIKPSIAQDVYMGRGVASAEVAGLLMQEAA